MYIERDTSPAPNIDSAVSGGLEDNSCIISWFCLSAT